MESSAPNLLMVEGSFYDQVDELAQYIDTLKHTPDALSGELASLLEKEEKDEVVRKLVGASSALSQAPEKEFIPAYNLLIHLVQPSSLLPELLPTLLANLSTLPPSSPTNGPALVLSILTTIFNALPTISKLRSTVFQAILKIVSTYGLYDILSPQLKHLRRWFAEWSSSDEEIRSILVTVANISEEAGDDEQFYNFLLSALHHFPSNEATSPAARAIAFRLVQAAISLPSRLDFDDLVALDSIQALAKSDPECFNLLEIFAGGDLEDYDEFIEVHEGWLEDNGLSHPALLRKIRLLTLASLSTRTPTRSLPYKSISKALNIPSEDVEMWVIDVIRARLVEGKLSQLNQTFLIHRSSYRVFGLDQWLEVSERLEVWKNTLRSILDVVGVARESVEGHAKGEREDMERKLEGMQRTIEVDA